jgi:hypothetical protein
MVFQNAGSNLLGFAFANARPAQRTIGVEDDVLALNAGLIFEFSKKF